MTNPRSELYGGRVIIEFQEKGHKYSVWVDGKKTKPASVTQITSVVDKSGPIQGWAVKTTLAACRELIKPGEYYSVQELNEIFETARKSSYQYKKEAADVGTAVHKWLELYFHGQNPDLPPEDPYLSCVQAALTWVKEHNVEIIENERPVYSIERDVSGRLDGIGLVNGKKSIIDYKTGNGVYSEAWMQTAAYQGFYEEENPKSGIEQRVIIRLGKEDGKFYSTVLPSIREDAGDYHGFMAAWSLYHRLKQIDKLKEKVEISTNKDWLDELV
jgi:hypothetical protein